MQQRSTGIAATAPNARSMRGSRRRLRDDGLEVKSFPGRLGLRARKRAQPERRLLQGLHPPFIRAAVAHDPPPGTPLRAPRDLPRAPFPRALDDLSVTLNELALEPRTPDWASGLRETWEADAAKARRGWSGMSA